MSDRMTTDELRDRLEKIESLLTSFCEDRLTTADVQAIYRRGYNAGRAAQRLGLKTQRGPNSRSLRKVA